MFRSID